MIILLRLSAGLVGWAVAFCLIYGLHGIGCARGWDRTTLLESDLQRVALIVTWLGCLAATLGVAMVLTRTRTTLLDRAAVVTGWSGFAATAVLIAPVIAIPTCV